MMECVFTDANFKKEVEDSELPVLVDFYADWCGPCKMMAPVVKALANEYDGKIKVGKCNVDENMETARKYGVMSIPNFVYIKNGQVVSRALGAMGEDELLDALGIE